MKKTRRMAVKDGGFGVPNINTFWKAIRMSWLRRLIASDATWAKLHRFDVSPFSFDPCKSNFDSLTNAKIKVTNLFWREVYGSLLECRLNVLLNHPQEYKYIPINGEPSITSNRVSIKQEWSLCLNLNSIIDKKGNLVGIDEVRSSRKPFDYEYNALKGVTKDFLDVYSGGKLGANSRHGDNIRHMDVTYNIYGRIVTKRKQDQRSTAPTQYQLGPLSHLGHLGSHFGPSGNDLGPFGNHLGPFGRHLVPFGSHTS